MFSKNIQKNLTQDVELQVSREFCSYHYPCLHHGSLQNLHWLGWIFVFPTFVEEILIQFCCYSDIIPALKGKSNLLKSCLLTLVLVWHKAAIEEQPARKELATVAMASRLSIYNKHPHTQDQKGFCHLIFKKE